MESFVPSFQFLQSTEELNSATMRQVAILFACAEEQYTVKELAIYLSCPKPSVVRSLDVLESKELVRRLIDYVDRRRIIVDLTAKGRLIVSRAMRLATSTTT